MKIINKSSLIVTKISKVSEKGNVTLSLRHTKNGFGGGLCLLMLTKKNFDAMEIVEGDDVLEAIGTFTLRESKWVDSDGVEQTSFWVQFK